MASRIKTDWITSKKTLRTKELSDFKSIDKEAKRQSKLAFAYKEVLDEEGKTTGVYDFEKNADGGYLDPITANVSSLIDDISDSVNNAKGDMDEIRDFMLETLGESSDEAKIRFAENSENAETVGGFTVGVDVPVNAVFTDTISNIGGISGNFEFTGTGISKSADGLTYTFTNTTDTSSLDFDVSPVADSSSVLTSGSIFTALSTKVEGSRVLTDVPANAKFTDTIYSKPDNEPIRYITGLQDALDAKLASETTTTLVLQDSILKYTDESGTAHDISLTSYIDDTNLARITSGSVATNGTATFTRDDNTTFDIDMSSFLDDTKLTDAEIAAMGYTKDTNTDTQLTDAEIAAMGYTKDTNVDTVTKIGQGPEGVKVSGDFVFSGNAVSFDAGTNTFTFTDTNTQIAQRAITSTPEDGATATSISADWAFDNVKTAVPVNAIFTDTTNFLPDTTTTITAEQAAAIASNTANFTDLFANNITAETITAAVGNFNTLFADEITAGTITADLINVAELNAAAANITNLTAENANITNLAAANATIGGWRIASNNLYSGSVRLDANSELIHLGEIKAWQDLTDTQQDISGILMGKNQTGYDLFIGKMGANLESGEYIRWDSATSTFTIKGTIDDGSTLGVGGTKTLGDIKAQTDSIVEDDGEGGYQLKDTIVFGDGITTLGDIKSQASASSAKIIGTDTVSKDPTTNKFTADLSAKANFIFDVSGIYYLETTNEASNIGQSGTIVINNIDDAKPEGIGDNWHTPNGLAIAFMSEAGGTSIISYFVVTADKVLVNYVGNFKTPV